VFAPSKLRAFALHAKVGAPSTTRRENRVVLSFLLLIGAAVGYNHKGSVGDPGYMFSLLDHNNAPNMGAIFLLCLALVGLIAGLIARRGGVSTSLSIWFSIAFGALALLTTDLLRPLCTSIGVAWAVTHRRWRTRHPEAPTQCSTKTHQIITYLGVLLISFALMYRLSSEYVPPLVWESTVILNFLKEMSDLDLAQALGSRLLWTQGLLSEGDRSLLYGFPTLYLLTHTSSLISVRFFSVLYFLGAALCLASLCKRFFTPTVATVALFTFGLNEVGLIFGRYGSSIASSLFSTVLAFFACASLVAAPSISKSILAVACLYLATLGYAPGRVIALILIGMTLIGIISNKDKRRSSRVSIALVLCAGIIVVCDAQHNFGRLRAYAHVRGEKLSTMLKTGYWPKPMLDKWNAFKSEGRAPTASDYISFGGTLLTSITIPQLKNLTSPFDQAQPAARRFSFDPLSLELYAKPLYPFLLLGLLLASSYTSRWIHMTLLAWLVLGTAPVLLTNRVDSYRVSMLLVPLAVWIAVGITEVLKEARRVRVPRLAIVCVLLATTVTITANRAQSLHYRFVQPTFTHLVTPNLEPRFVHNATIGVENLGFQQLALTKIQILRQQQHGMPVPGTILSAEQYEPLIRGAPSEERTRVIEGLIQDLTTNKPLILGPYEKMLPTLEELSHQGFTVQLMRVGERNVAVVVKE
jgi:hypothetical protein